MASPHAILACSIDFSQSSHYTLQVPLRWLIIMFALQRRCYRRSQSGSVEPQLPAGYERNANGPTGNLTSWAQPSGLSLDASGKRLFVADSESSSVREMDTETFGGAFSCFDGGFFCFFAVSISAHCCELPPVWFVDASSRADEQCVIACARQCFLRPQASCSLAGMAVFRITSSGEQKETSRLQDSHPLRLVYTAKRATHVSAH